MLTQSLRYTLWCIACLFASLLEPCQSPQQASLLISPMLTSDGLHDERRIPFSRPLLNFLSYRRSACWVRIPQRMEQKGWMKGWVPRGCTPLLKRDSLPLTPPNDSSSPSYRPSFSALATFLALVNALLPPLSLFKVPSHLVPTLSSS